MINGFDKQTEPLTEYELNVLVPVIAKGLSKKVGKDMAVTNKFIVSRLRSGYKISEARVRKIINYIRTKDIVPCLIATSDGYYVSEDESELKDYEDSLIGRENAIREVRLSIHRQRNVISESHNGSLFSNF